MEATLPRPIARPPIPENIPASLKAVRRWVCWDYEFVDERWTKVPKIAEPGKRNALTNAPATWRSFDQALTSAKEDKYDGIGFVFGKDEKTGITYSGVDIDGSVDEKGEIDPGAWFRICSLPSYAEISPSGTGVHIITSGELPKGKRADHKVGFEIYCSGRFFTFTGQIIPGRPVEVRNCTKELAEMHTSVFTRVPGGCRLSEREIAISALKSLNNSRADDYTEWLNIGMALKCVADDLFGEWESWSRQSAKFTEGACAKKWESMKGRGITIGSLIVWAKQDGWIFPAGGKNAPTCLPVAQARNSHESNGVAPREIKLDPNDPHMGDGLTDNPGAGPWRLKKVKGVPPIYQLSSPIWEKSPELAASKGFITLSLEELYNWPLIRKAATTQADVYVPKDLRETPVWDNHGDFCLLRRLINTMDRVRAPVDNDTTLSAAEYILEKGLGLKPTPDEARIKIKKQNISLLEDGTIVLRIRAFAATTKISAPGITFDHILAATRAYGSEYWPRIDNKQLGRFHRFTPEQVAHVQNLLSENADDG